MIHGSRTPLSESRFRTTNQHSAQVVNHSERIKRMTDEECKRYRGRNRGLPAIHETKIKYPHLCSPIVSEYLQYVRAQA